MNQTKMKRLVLSLIKDDLINNKLIMGLNAAGLSADDYCLDLSGTILNLLGYEENQHSEDVYKGYIGLTKRAKEIDNSISNEGFNPLANEIYNYLIQRRPKKQTT